MAKSKATAQQMIDIYEKHGGSHIAIAEELGISRERVRQVLSPLGYLPTRRNRKIEKSKEDIKNLVEQGLGAKEISNEVSVSIRSIRKSLKKLGHEELAQAKRGPEISYSNELLIEKYRQCNGNYSQIAKEIGTTASSVQRMFKNRNLIKQYPSSRAHKKQI